MTELRLVGGLTRRQFIQRATALGLSLPAISVLLAACGGGDEAAADLAIGTPSSPVTQPLFEDNVAIASGLPAEAGPLRVYNWTDYFNPDTLPAAEAALGVPVELTTFFNEEEALAKLLSGEVNFDVWFPAAESIPKVVAGQLLQPLNHDYLPNLSNVWPQLADPFYDKGSVYSVPYVVWTTGIAWRTDMVDDADVTDIENPWDVLWNPKYKGITGLYDDFRETMYMALFRNGVAKPSAASASEIDAAANALIELIETMSIRYTIDGTYDGIPNGRFGLHEAWSGDAVNAQYYFPEGGDPSVLRYHWPAASGTGIRGGIANDTMTVLRGAQNPVLAHQFLNFMLDEGNATENFSWTGYLPPQNGLNVDTLVVDEWIPENLATAVVRPEDFEAELAVVPTQLAAEQEALFIDAWTKVQAGG